MLYKIKMKQNVTQKIGTCKENGQKLHMNKPSCIQNSTFLYMTQNEIIK
jgi:hypothetical protein